MRRRVIYIFALLLLVHGVSSLEVSAQEQAQTNEPAKKLTLDRLFSSPSLGGSLVHGVQWTPDGKRISYFHPSSGGAELWVLDVQSGKRAPLVGAKLLTEVLQPPKEKATQSTGLGRVAPQDYQWSADGKDLLFVSDTSLAWLDLDSKKPKTLVSGDDSIEDAKISPDGKWVSFVQNYNVSIVNIESGEKKQITQGGSEEILEGKLDWLYPEELGARTAYWWSPDSTQIAYYEMDERKVTQYPIYDMSTTTGAVESTRYPQAGEPNPIVRVGVVPISGGDTRWLDTGKDTDVYVPRVNWTPDSKSVAVQILNRAQTRLELRLFDAANGSSRPLLTEQDKYWVNVGDDLYFFSDGQRFLWTSERDNYRHLYIYGMDGKLIKQLTKGDWGVLGVQGFGPHSSNGLVVDEKNGAIYFLSEKGSVVDTQVYKLSLESSEVTQVTREPGVHDVEMSPDFGMFIDSVSRADVPPHQEIDRVDGQRVAMLTENAVPELATYHLPATEFKTIHADDGTELYASLIKPGNFDPSKKYPVLVEVYGGPGAQQIRDQWHGGRLFSKFMAEQGFVVWSLDNRGSTGRGHNFETPLYHRMGTVELADQLAGVKYLQSLPFVEGSRIGIWGWSYGGYMTLTALMHAADVFKVGVAVAPVADWRLYDTAYTERYMGTPQEDEEGYKNSAPANFTDNLRGKLMVAHGTGDDNVHFANTALLLNKLIEAGKYPQYLMVFPGRGHPISDRPATLDLFHHIVQFLVDNLK
jgi:dipeptidyl-peptidase-4